MKREAWRYYAGCYRWHRRDLAVMLLLAVVQFTLVLPLVLLVRYIFDTAIPSGEFRLLLAAAAGMLGLNLAQGAVQLWLRHKTLETTKIVIREIRNDLLARLYAFSRTRYSTADQGRLHAGIVHDTERVDIMSNALIAQILPAVVVGGALLAVLGYLNWMLLLLMLAVMPFLVAVNRWLGNKVKARFRRFRRSFEDFSQGMLFVLRMMDLTRLQTAEEFERRRQWEKLESLRVTSGSMAWLESAYSLVQNNVAMTATILILVAGGYAVSAGTMSMGDLLAFFVTARLLNQQLQTALNGAPKILSGNESLVAVHALILESDVAPYTGRQRIAFTGAVRFESVDFRYVEERWVLRSLDLEIPARTTVAITGPNGSGKSTLTHLICGFYRPERGRLLADGHPYDNLDIVDLRRSIGVVMQNPILFPGTILDNIAYGAQDASQEDVSRAAELATAADFIEKLPRRYETEIGEEGLLLSGGQRQRIALARAILRRPKLLLLDEPTNHLDVEAVRQLVDNLKQLDPAPSIIVITHDVGLAGSADQSFRMRDGRLWPYVAERVS